MTAENFKKDLQNYASEKDAIFLQRFFKTGPGQYGEGDVLIGVRVPKTREVCKKFSNLPISEINILVDSDVHEHRLGALIIVTDRFKRSNPAEQKNLYDFYLSALRKGKIDNWDLVDVSCDHVVGQYLMNKPKDVLYELAKSSSLWERRASIMATFAFIKAGKSEQTLKLAVLLLHDNEDLIHKAVGWMLREVGKRVNENDLCDFLDRHAHEMPRTMLRYSLEKLSIDKKQKYMKMKLA